MSSNFNRTDNGNILEFTIEDSETGEIVDLTNVQSITFQMRTRGGILIQKDCTVSDAVNGKCELYVDNALSENTGRFEFNLVIITKNGEMFNSDLGIITVGNNL